MRYFVDAGRRLTRTIWPGESTDHINFDIWKEVTYREYHDFRLETSQNYSPRKLKQLRAGGALVTGERP